MKKAIGFFEIGMIVIAIISFAYLIHESNPTIASLSEQYEQGEYDSNPGLFDKIKSGVSWWLSRSKIQRVSAQSSGLWTCPVNHNGSICQEYLSDVCEDNCAADCLPGQRDEFAECELGTCFNPEFGDCTAQTPHAECEDRGGEWYEQPPAQCNLGCCVIGSGGQTIYDTEQACLYQSQALGVPTEWDPGIDSIACNLAATSEAQGACVLGPDPEQDGRHDCRFTSQTECQGLGGTFNKDFLCSHPELFTICERQDSVSCVEGKDELYWLDSCGNRENIYDANKIKSWNNGLVLSKAESCELPSSSSPGFDDEIQSCGNCNFLQGSICGEPEDDEIVDSELGNVICTDLSCVDEWGDVRKNGESWCAFNSQIGVKNDGDPNSERSVDLPGSRHYRRVCIDGSVRTEACADFRSEVCVEGRSEEAGFSSAACRLNQAALCLEANSDQDELNECEERSDCTLHNVNIDKNFQFDICAPKHPSGFDLTREGGGETAETICSMATQTCTVIEVKEIDGWEYKVNEDCLDPGFTEAMNNLCMSLGDCGGSVNIIGEYSDDGYRIREQEKVSDDYISGLQELVEPIQGQTVDALSGEELAALYGLSEADFNEPETYADIIGGISGASAFVLLTAVELEIIIPGLIEFTNIIGTFRFGFIPVDPGLSATGGVVAGALIGAAIVAFALEFTGVSAGIPPALTYGLIATGAAGAAIIGLEIFSKEIATICAIGGGIGCILAGVVAVVILVLALAGIGDTRETHVQFKCSPWQPVSGGESCGECGTHGLGCSEYECQSLGKNCRLINEGSPDAECVNIAPNDVSPPVIDIEPENIGGNLSYLDPVTNTGVSIRSEATEDGCIPEYTPVQFGLELDEPGQCKITTIPGTTYDEIESFAGGSNLYKQEHDVLMALPTLITLGVPGVDPARRGDLSLFIRCQDSSGNQNEKDYVVDICVSPANDVTPPILTFVPPSPGYAGFDVDSKVISFFTNEPADCRWSSEDKAFDSMVNNASCHSGINQVTPQGWGCLAELPTQEDEQTFNFRCRDQPWLEADDDETNNADRNTNTESYVYEIQRTSEPLDVTVIQPSDDEEITASGAPVTAKLAIETSGGLDSNAICEYTFDQDSGIYSQFLETGGSRHEQTFSSLFQGEYRLGLRCTDNADNVAESETRFFVVIDDDGPTVGNVFVKDGVFHAVTDEAASCVYSTSSCSYLYDKGEPMSGSDLDHTTDYVPGKTYHIICRDFSDNTGSCLSVTGGF